MLSTYRPGNDMIVRNSTAPDGKYQKIRLARPTNIGDYNHGMGGTDVFDQYCSYYRTMVRTKKWPMKIFTHFIMASIVNAFILYKYNSHDDATLLSFITLLLEEISVHRRQDPAKDSEAVNEQTEPVQPRRRSSWLNEVNKRLTGTHTSQEKETKRQRDKETRRRCVVCDTRTGYRCMQCDSALCVGLPSETSCYEIFHSLEGFS